MSVFEISLSFSSEFSISYYLVLSPKFFCFVCFKRFFIPQKCLSELLQNLCFFVCIWNIFQFFLGVLTIIFFCGVINVFCFVCFKRFFIPKNICLVCFRICVSLSVFEISFSFSLEFSLSSFLVLSQIFFVFSVLRGSLFPKTFVCFASEFVLTGPNGTMCSVIVQCNVCTIQFVCLTWAEAKKSTLELFWILLTHTRGRRPSKKRPQVPFYTLWHNMKYVQ